jgi:hypothetical protein
MLRMATHQVKARGSAAKRSHTPEHSVPSGGRPASRAAFVRTDKHAKIESDKQHQFNRQDTLRHTDLYPPFFERPSKSSQRDLIFQDSKPITNCVHDTGTHLRGLLQLMPGLVTLDSR